MFSLSNKVSYLERGVVALDYWCPSSLVPGADIVIIVHVAFDQRVQVKVGAIIVDVSLKKVRVRTHFHNGL